VFITIDSSKDNWEQVKDEITDNLVFDIKVDLKKVKNGDDEKITELFRAKHKELLKGVNVFVEASSDKFKHSADKKQKRPYGKKNNDFILIHGLKKDQEKL